MQCIQHLMHGFHSHDAYLSRLDAEAAGIAVQAATSGEETLLWQIYEVVHDMFTDTAVSPPPTNTTQPPVKLSIDALIANTASTLTHSVQTVEYIQNGGQGGPMRITVNAQWQKLGNTLKNGTASSEVTLPTSKV